MASIGSIRLNPTSNFVVDQHPLLPNRFLSTPSSLIRTPSSQKAPAASIALSDFATYSSLFKHQENPQRFQEKDSVFTDNLDSWLRDSVVEIVKNLKKAPLLVHVYSKNNGEIMEVKTEEGVAENWPDVKKQWKFGETKCPDGIILVEELQDDAKDFEINRDGIEEGGETKAWGVLIQGRMVEESQREYNRPSCYLLKTCRVNSGLGFFGTHFSLIRVNSFKESAFSQIKNSWLLR